MAFTSVFSLASSFHLFSRILDTVASVPSLPSDFFSFPSSAFPLLWELLWDSSLIRHPLPCTRFRSSFSVISYLLVVLWLITLIFWWTVPLFLLIYLCEVFLYEFIISPACYLSIHFSKNFQKFLICIISCIVFYY